MYSFKEQTIAIVHVVNAKLLVGLTVRVSDSLSNNT